MFVINTYLYAESINLVINNKKNWNTKTEWFQAAELKM